MSFLPLIARAAKADGYLCWSVKVEEPVRGLVSRTVGTYAWYVKANRLLFGVLLVIKKDNIGAVYLVEEYFFGDVVEGIFKPFVGLQTRRPLA